MAKGNYVQVSRALWKQSAFREVVASGTEATLLALYFMTAPASNMIGLYEASVSDIARHTGLNEEAVFSGIGTLASIGWIKYDHDSQTVWDCGALQRQYGGKANERQFKGLVNSLVRLHEEEAPFIEEVTNVLCHQYPAKRAFIEERVSDLCYVRDT